MAALPYMQLYVADYLADTMHLSVEEHGAYLLLLMNYWQTGKPLADNDVRLQCVCKANAEQWQCIRPTLAEFFDIRDGFWVHHRVETDLEKVRSKSQSARKAAQKRYAKPATKPRSSERSANAQRTHCHTDTDTDTDQHLGHTHAQQKQNGEHPGQHDPPPDDGSATIPPRSPPTHGHGHGFEMAIGGWQPGDAEAAKLKMAGIRAAVEAEDVAAFTAHFADQYMSRDQAGNKFVKWMARKQQTRGSKHGETSGTHRQSSTERFWERRARNTAPTSQ